MNQDHYALVIGLSKYTSLGSPPPADLSGPENDAAAVTRWLTDPGGGALPAANVKTLVSSQFAPNQPGRDELEDAAFMWIETLAQANRAAGNGRRVGRRLYFHVSGHGFSPQRGKGCMVAANAYDDRPNRNIGISAWLEWWQDAGYFSEFVLSVDCCMDRMPMGIAAPAPLQAIGAGQPPGPSFVAFAAQRPLKAVERPIPEAGDLVHGVFTWSLLQGLRGAARNDMGRVTGRSLADWLRNAIHPWLEPGDLKDTGISKWPEIVAEDDLLELARPPGPLLFDVTLRFDPMCAGQTGRLWSGVPPSPQPLTVGPDAVAACRLAAGLNAAEITAGGVTWRQAFAVTRAAEVPITERGAPIVQPAADPTLTIDPGDPTAEIRVVRADFRAIAAGRGQISTPLPFGIYKAIIQVGRQFGDRVVILDQAWSPTAAAAPPAASDLPSLPPFTSAAPLSNTAADHEYHEGAAETLALGPPDVDGSAGAELMVMARCYTPDDAESPVRQPWAGVLVLNAQGDVIADLSKDGTRDEKARDPWAGCKIAVVPGAYTLQYQQPDKSGRLERSLVVPPAADGGPAWRLEAYLLLRKQTGDAPASNQLVVSLLMHRAGTWDREGAGDLLMEKARIALADERPILTDEVSELLLQKFLTPLSGIIAGHLVLLGDEKHEPSSTSLDEIVRNLRGLVGTDHPDVEALSLRCNDPTLRRTKPFTAPPLLERSWHLIVAASQTAPELVPLALWQKVHALVAAPPFLVWSADQQIQASYREGLRETLLSTPRVAATYSKEPVPLELVPLAEPGDVEDAFMFRPSLADTPFSSDVLGSFAHAFGIDSDRGGAGARSLLERTFGAPVSAPADETRPTVPSDVQQRAERLGLPPVALAVLRADT